MTLRDLLTNDEVVIAERRATTQVVVWDVLVARVVSHADGSRQLEGSVMLLPALSAPAIVKALKAEHRRARRVDPDIRDDAFFKMTAPLFYIMWDELVAGALPPELQTVEGDALSFSELIFDVPKGGDALAALLVQPDFEPGELGQAVWLEPGDDGPRLLADVSCAKGTLSLRALSRERAGRARARVEEVVGALRLRSEHHTAPDLDEGPAVARHTTPAGAIDIDDVPELAVWRDQQDRAWLDLDIPALDGKTPRQAAKSRRMKPRLVQLLIDIENREARMAAPKPARDLTWMWKELGLERP
jgi:hypothetical protein